MFDILWLDGIWSYESVTIIHYVIFYEISQLKSADWFEFWQLASTSPGCKSGKIPVVHSRLKLQVSNVPLPFKSGV